MKCIWDLDQWKHNNINSSKINFSQKSLYFKFEQEVQGPQAFAFSVVTVNYEHTRNLGSKESAGLNLKWAYLPNCV